MMRLTCPISGVTAAIGMRCGGPDAPDPGVTVEPLRQLDAPTMQAGWHKSHRSGK